MLALFDYHYWATRQVLRTAADAPADVFTGPSEVTWRNIRGTLVHTLDVERSWRGRVRGEPKETWDVELPQEDFPNVDALSERWARDEAEMRSWLEGLADADLEAMVDLGEKDHFPLWYFLMHIVTHTAQQRRDAVVLLTNAGHPPPEIEFLNYADWLRDSADAQGGA